MKKTYIETPKPASLKDVDYPLFYMYANGWDTPDGKPIYLQIGSDVVLEIAYKVYREE